MAFPSIGSPGVGLPFPGQNSSLICDYRSLAPGQKHLIPAGEYQLVLGPYTVYQLNDPVQGWTTQVLASDGVVASDGVNHRIANLTGCVIGALVTTAGSGYLTPPTITPSAGSSTWQAIIGGMISTTVTVATAGVGFNHPPSILLPPPPAGGVQATCVASVSGGGITSVTMIGVGAGYTTAPIAAPATTGNATLASYGPYQGAYTIAPDAADTITTPAVLTFSLQTGVAASSISAILMTDPGVPVTAVPTLTIAAAPTGGTTAIATAIPLFTVTSLAVSSAGSNYGTSQSFQIVGAGALVSGTAANVQSMLNQGLFQPSPFFGYGTSLSSGILAATGMTISNGGLHQAVPTLAVIEGGATVPTSVAQVTANVGGVNDTSYLVRR